LTSFFVDLGLNAVKVVRKRAVEARKCPTPMFAVDSLAAQSEPRLSVVRTTEFAVENWRRGLAAMR